MGLVPISGNIGLSVRCNSLISRVHTFVLPSSPLPPVHHSSSPLFSSVAYCCKLLEYSCLCCLPRFLPLSASLTPPTAIAPADCLLVLFFFVFLAQLYLGVYESELEAAKAHDRAARFHFPDKSMTNFATEAEADRVIAEQEVGGVGRQVGFWSW